MLERVTISGIKIPPLYIARTNVDARVAEESGLPYIKWKESKDELIKFILRPVLERIFPDIKWDKVLGPKRKFRSNIITLPGGDCEAYSDEQSTEYHKPASIEGTNSETVDIADGPRKFNGGYSDEEHEPHHEKLSLEKYIGDISASVNVDVLQRLNLLPKFMSDIVDCIRHNLSSIRWTEGYNKKLGQAVGTFSSNKELPNLIILDISGSIPRGISATMISLIDTLRTQVHADLIITSDISRFYKYGEELPSPQKIRNMFGYGNESRQFFKLLDKHIRGKEYGHVISFGDYDQPDYDSYLINISGTKVHTVHHYHTGVRDWYGKRTDRKTGYALWCHEIAYLGGTEYDTSWCSIIER